MKPKIYFQNRFLLLVIFSLIAIGIKAVVTEGKIDSTPCRINAVVGIGKLISLLEALFRRLCPKTKSGSRIY